MEVLPVGSIGQKRGTTPRADFLMAAASGLSTTRSRTLDLGLSRKPEHLGTAPPQVNVISNPLFARVPIYERYEKISGRAYSGKITMLGAWANVLFCVGVGVRFTHATRLFAFGKPSCGKDSERYYWRDYLKLS